MGKLLCDTSAVAEGLMLSPAQVPAPVPSTATEHIGWAGLPSPEPMVSWEDVNGLEDQQRRNLGRIYAKGVLWCDPRGGATGFRLSHGGEVAADGNCLFAAAGRAAGVVSEARDLRRRAVSRFMGDYGVGGGWDEVNAAVRHLYSPDLSAGWGVHVVQEVKLLARKADRESLDASIQELVDLGLQRESAAESIYKERCMAVDDGASWAKYMSISGSPEDEHDIITLQYTEEGLLSVDENHGGHAAAFGDDIAIECLATEFGREIFVVQAHGSDAMVDEDNCVFFLPHRPRGQILHSPIFLFMKGSGWCGAGADHYEPLVVTPITVISQEKAAMVL